MYITDSKIIESWTAAYIADAIEKSIIIAIRRTRPTREEARQWSIPIANAESKTAARMETIAAIDRTLARDIYSAYATIEEEVWNAVRAHFDLTGHPEEIVKALGEDYGDIVGVARDGLEDKAKAQAAEIVARRIADQAAILKEK